MKRKVETIPTFRRLAYNLYFFPDIFETRQRNMKKSKLSISQFPCQPSLPTLFIFYITAAEIKKGTSELICYKLPDCFFFLREEPF